MAQSKLISVIVPLYKPTDRQISNLRDVNLRRVEVVQVEGNGTWAEQLLYGITVSTGRYILCGAQDLIFRTQDWDDQVLSVFSRFPDDIALVYCNDLLLGKSLACFPILSRQALEISGIPTYYRHFRTDDHIHHTYDILRSLGHDRIVYLPDVIIEHDHYFILDGRRVYSNAGDAVRDNEASCAYRIHIRDRIEDAFNLAMAIDPTREQEYVDLINSKTWYDWPCYFREV